MAASMARRFETLYLTAPAAARAAGWAWYPLARGAVAALAEQHGLEPARVACVVAALSPRMRWSKNLGAADALLSGRPVAALGRSKARALAVARGAHPGDVLRGSKVRAFARALAGDDRAAVCDVWILRAAGFPHDKPTALQYARVARALRHAAVRLGVATATLQAVIWCVVRGERSRRARVE